MQLKKIFKPNTFKVILTIIASAAILYGIYNFVFSQSANVGACAANGSCPNYYKIASQTTAFLSIPVILIDYFISCIIYLLYKNLSKKLWG